MAKIHVMSDLLANKIAAGEVVERIASVVKELVENSIDAAASQIEVNLNESGTSLIEVIDDGYGMDKEDALLAFERHATSKIRKEEDLFFINTLGFRGEALASIASVSKVDMKTSNGKVGTHIVIEGGKLITNEHSDLKIGTKICIKDLFYNTPARLKYLKSETTELANVTSYMEKLALSHSDISFTLTNNGKRIIFTSGSGELLKTIHEIYGYTVSSNMLEINVSTDDFDISGYICKPSVLKSNKNHMTTFVNGRVVKNVNLNKAINEGYFTFKPDIKYPVVVLNIDTDPTLIDVNIHPSKADIKISKLQELMNTLTKEINHTLKKALLITDMKVGINVDTPFIIEGEEEKIDDFTKIEEYTLNFSDEKIKVKEEELFKKASLEVEDNSSNKFENEMIKSLELTPIGIALATFIIAENEDGIYLIDQHAAHERINYEKVVKEFDERKISTQEMLVPITKELSSSDFIKITEHFDDLLEFGFKIEEFGINTIIIKEHPIWLREGYEEETISKIIDLVISDEKFDKMKINNRILATIACKMSVRANEVISLEEADRIIKDLVKCNQPYNCPHGRPTIIHYTKYELEKMFKRVMN